MDLNVEQLPKEVLNEYFLLADRLESLKDQDECQEKFLEFVRLVWPGFIEGEHHRIIAQKFQDVAEGKLKRLIVNMPPRHTKSEFASYLFPAWLIGRRPDLKIIQTTHTGELAVRFGRKMRTIWIVGTIAGCFRKQNFVRIPKRRGGGKLTRVASTTHRVLGAQLQAVVLIC